MAPEERPDGVADGEVRDIDLEEVYRFNKMPDHIEFGQVLPCYRCKGRGTEPGSKKTKCHRCLGMGIIPNKGPIP